MRLAKEAASQAEEEENLKLFKELTSWWNEAREELKVDNSQPAEVEVDKLVPD
ncbi:UNVERIFIED_CONTAM: hypothetical protein Slati_3729400 [Sesamum latifolium]|uniref:Uncharacterized protein n=1 Tax=Sesamum latifolium TaxID=2727402 RepID=A0AAW2U436_9LAMI